MSLPPVVALLPPPVLELVTTTGDDDGGNRRKACLEDIERVVRHVAADDDRGGYRLGMGIAFRLDAQVIVTGRNRGNRHAVVLAAFGPVTVAIAAMIVADLAAEVVGVARVAVDERVVEID